MCPTTKPCVPPLKRPSVINATSLPSPRPMIALVGDSISRMPGPPRGPSWRMTMTWPFFTRPSRMRLERRLLALEHDRLAAEALAFLAADLRHRAAGREIAVQDDEVAVLLDRVVEAAHDDPGRPDSRPASSRFSASVRPVTVRHSPCSSPSSSSIFISGVSPPMRDQVSHQVAAARLQIRQHRHALADAREIVEAELDAGGVRHGEEMQHRVGRAAQRDDHRDRVLERLLREDVARTNAASRAA